VSTAFSHRPWSSTRRSRCRRPPAYKTLRETRDNSSVATRLDALQEIAKGSDNMMPAIIDCVRARATEGEIVEALRDVFGTHRETPVF